LARDSGLNVSYHEIGVKKSIIFLYEKSYVAQKSKLYCSHLPEIQFFGTKLRWKVV